MLNESVYVIYDKITKTVWSVHQTNGIAMSTLRTYAEDDEPILNGTLRSGICVKTMSVFEALKLLLPGKVCEL